MSGTYYIHVYDGWLQSSAIGGPWSQGFIGPLVRHELDAMAQALSAAGTVDLLDGGKSANPKPSLANGVPTITTSQVPTELIVFKGQPDFVPIAGTQLLWAANTTSDALIDTANNNYYVLLSGRWFRAAALAGPWTFVPSDALPADFARIPPQSLAGAVLPTVAGTPQAQEAVISNSIPQTATVPLKNGPRFTPTFDGPPQYRPIEGTSLSYVANASEPLIQVAPNAYYAVVAGVWFTAAQVTGPWTIATSVPPVIYTIPPSSSLYYVTYVKIYEATPQVVYVGYTPATLARSSRRTARSSTAPATRTARGSARSGTRRPTPTASTRRRSTTRGSGTRSALRRASPRRLGWIRIGAGAAGHGIAPATGGAIPAAERRVRTSTATGATRPTPARAAGTQVAGWRDRRSRAPTRRRAAPPAISMPDGSSMPGPATRRAATTGHSTPRPAATATWRAPATPTSTPASARPPMRCPPPVRAAAPTTAPERPRRGRKASPTRAAGRPTMP